jgi:hypothetical protein
MAFPPATRCQHPGRRGGAWIFPRAAVLTLGLLTLGLAGCSVPLHYASSPFVGFPGFIADTHTFNRNPNLPPGNQEVQLQSEGKTVPVTPLLPEGGNIWPGPAPLDPTLADVGRMLTEPGGGQFQQLNPPGQQVVPTLPQEQPVPHGSSTPPGTVQTSPSTPSRTPPFSGSSPPTLTTPAPPASFATPAGPLINNGPVGVPGGASTATNPAGGGQNIVVPNGNGTSTVIGPDGTTTIIPSPK